jgi:hypothetical protein
MRSHTPLRRPSRLAPLAALSALAAAASVGTPSEARTQAEAWDEALAASVRGRWTLAISEADARRAVEDGIAAAVADLPAIVDSIAARELRARIVVSPRVTLALGSDRIEAHFAHASFRSAPGVPVRTAVPGDPATSMEVVQLLRGGRLEQVFTTDGGRRWTTFTPSTDGARLTLDSVIRSERLPTDVRFRLPYRRTG